MTKLRTCPACRGFLPPSAEVCPHCDARVEGRSTLLKVAVGAAAIVGGAVTAITLAACYGVAYPLAPPDLQGFDDLTTVPSDLTAPPVDGGADLIMSDMIPDAK